ncbi:NUDIX domain-containing protein [Nubsella zeaxanthinifaciens]|uniref:NUDIX domain-containing protein n=1 Tax=Nubsella zeaxanthinifaciens TaxID=392412 RepID=UPI003CFEA50D
MKTSAGILLYRTIGTQLQVFLVHPGGPFWKNKDEGAWSIPKGEFEMGENPLDAAKREFEEETGQKVDGYFIPLEPVKLKSGKVIYAWAVEGDIDANHINSNLIEIPWPPKSGKMLQVPEVDRGEWFDEATAMTKINSAQAKLVEQLAKMIEKA